MELSSVLKLVGAALLPVVFAIIFYLLEKKTKYGKLPYMLRQVVIGIVFGAMAVLGTEFGIPLSGAVVNVRDGAVLTAGLVFGGPAGIIAGLIGGIERWIAVAWGVGSFTRVACSVSTALAGFYAAAIKKYMFNNKKPGWVLSFAIGVVMEVFHLTMVFITNLDQSEKAMQVVAACTIPMVIANALCVMLAALAISLIVGEEVRIGIGTGKKKIADTIQKWLLIVVAFAFVITSLFVYKLQDTTSNDSAEKFLSLAVEDTIADVEDAANRGLIEVARDIDEVLDIYNIYTVAFEYDVSEINMVNNSGFVVATNVSSKKNYNMTFGTTTAEFMCLTKNKDEYAQKLQAVSGNEDVLRKYVGIKTDYGFLQVGFDELSFQDSVANEIVYAAKNKHVGNSGFIVITNKIKTLVSAPESISFSKLDELMPAYEKTLPEENVVFRTTVNGEDCFGWRESIEGFNVFAFMPVSEAQTTRNIALYANVFMEVLVFALLFALVYFLIVKVVVNQITKFNRSLYKIRNGNLNEVVDVRDNYEFAYLSDDINATVDTLKHYIDEAAARIDADLKMAKDIQSSALPSIFPAFPQRTDFDVYARMDTAKEVGGDFYDFYMTDSSHINLLIADVSGKGIPAAMFMMRAKTQLASLTKSGSTIDQVFTRGNDALCEGNDAGMFVTAWQGGVDLDTGLVKFANAGHNPPVLKRANGKFEYLKAKVNLVLAGMEGAPYRQQEFQLEKGDTLFLYTDGVTEATDANNELYGEDRLLTILNSREFTDMKDLCDSVKEDVDKFVKEAPQFDDITMVAFKYVGQETKMEKLEVSVKSTIDNNQQISDAIDEYLDKIECPVKSKMQLMVVVDEIITNIASYAYENSSLPEDQRITFAEIWPENGGVKMRFMDKGVKYNPLAHEDPDITLSAEERGVGGLGIFMVKKMTDSVEYVYEDGKNKLTVFKKFEE